MNICFIFLIACYLYVRPGLYQVAMYSYAHHLQLQPVQVEVPLTIICNGFREIHGKCKINIQLYIEAFLHCSFPENNSVTALLVQKMYIDGNYHILYKICILNIFNTSPLVICKVCNKGPFQSSIVLLNSVQ